jgi:hypothetical protein
MKTFSRMKTGLVAFTVAALLGGCLSDEVTPSDSGQAPDPGGSTNSAPTISGNPPTAIRVGDVYSFTPQASDPDGDALTFSIQNKPLWASFDGSTGEVSGTPTLGDIGSYANIAVSVSDGELVASTSGFAIEVTQIATSSTTLSWTAPSLNDDGSALTDLVGYKLYYGQSSGSYSNEISIDNVGITTYVVDNLSPGTYYFAATAINSSGVESRFSGEAVKTLN